MRLLLDEPITLTDLKNALLRSANDLSGYSVAVEALIFDAEPRLHLMWRGERCQDGVGKLEGVGGRVENEDLRSELRRELAEEVGTEVNIEILRFFEVRYDEALTSSPAGDRKKVWLIVSYLCYLRSGILSVCEPDANAGFSRVNVFDVNKDDLTSSAAGAIRSLVHQWPEVYQLIRGAHS
jgi:ADP-ribose pyrophosphatase YjhB (NUDIX family)